MPSETLQIKAGSKLEERILNALRERWKLSASKMSEAHTRWLKAENRFMLYVPRNEADAVRENRRDSGIPQYTTIVVPYAYGMVLTAYSYWASVFLSRTPIFQFTSRKQGPSTSVIALEALIDYQVQQGGMIPALHAYLMDIGKFGMGILEDCWESEDLYISQWEKGVDPLSGRAKNAMSVFTVPGYTGNKIYNVRPYDFYPDPRVPMFRYRDGEYVSIYCEHGLWALRQWEDQGYYCNIDALRDAGPVLRMASSGEAAPNAIMPRAAGDRVSTDALMDAEPYGLLRFTVMLKPSDWELTASKRYEKWNFVTSADCNTLICARPQGLLHAQFPYSIGVCEPDAYALVVRGLFDALEGVQDTMDWLVNSRYFNVRAMLNSSLIVDPSRIVMPDLTNPAVPEKRIVRLKPEAYGTDPGNTFAQLTLADVTQGNIADTRLMHEFGQRATGISDAIMGMVETRGRRSATEFRTSAAGSAGRLKTSSELVSAMAFSGLAARLVQNSQQYYEGDQLMRIVGEGMKDLVEGQFVPVTPEAITGFFDYIPVDGTLPIDRLAQAQMLQQLMTVATQLPQIGQEYDLAAMFAWIAKLSGLKEMGGFKMTPEKQAQLQVLNQGEAPGGDVVPMPSPQAMPMAAAA